LIILKPTVKLRSSLIDEFMNWYNFIRPHGAFDIKRLETPAMIFYKRLPKKEIIDQ
jgi:transposase InsO family protein